MATLDRYLSTFTEHQSFVQAIAKQMLGTSYNLAKSNGFRDWQAKQVEVESKAAMINTTVEQESEEPREVLKVKKARNTRVKPIYKKLLDFLERNFDEGAVCLEGVDSFGLSSLPCAGGVYWLTNKSDVLFFGTTSNLKKNVMLAIKCIKKKSSDESLTEAINQLIDKNCSVGPATMCLVYLETDNAKKRIRIKNKAKSETSFTPVLE